MGEKSEGSPVAAGSPRESLGQVRSELRRLGYLSDRFDRFLLQDAMRPHGAGRALLELTVRIGCAIGVLVALVGAFALAILNGNLDRTPLDLVLLFLHLLVPSVLLSMLLFGALGGALLLMLRIYPVRRIEALSLTVALIAGAAALGVSLWKLRDLLAERPPWWVAVAALALLPALYAVIKVVSDGLLALAIRWTHRVPRGRFLSRRRAALVILVAAFLPILPALLAVNRAPEPPPASLPSAPGDRVVLIGVDGVLAEEIEYLLERGDLPVLDALLGRAPTQSAGDSERYGEFAGDASPSPLSAGTWLSYRRPVVPPADFWTTVATGIPSPHHGVTSLDSFRPLGVATPLARSGWLRHYWQRVEVPLGLADYRPVLSNRRRSHAFWELVARGGDPVLVVDWWTTFPAEELPGLTVAHGANQLMGEGVAGVVAPADEVTRIQTFWGAVNSTNELSLDPALRERALAPDEFYRRVFVQAFDRLQPRASALYLPALDVAADGWQGGALAFADLVRGEVQAAMAVLAGTLASLEGAGYTVIVVFDPGRRAEGGEGRVLLARSQPCAASRGPEPIEPPAVASALFRALGLPQSAELPPPAADCSWPSPPAQVATYGERRPDPAADATPGDAEYLESLRALGYL
ncbi:MAG: hypothetical protein AAF481_00145 [Acidobacteriota bacterium]